MQEKITTTPYRTYLNKYKSMTVSELETTQTQLEASRDEAVKTLTEKQFNGTRDEEFNAWIIAHDLNAELETLNRLLNIKRIEDGI